MKPPRSSPFALRVGLGAGLAFVLAFAPSHAEAKSTATLSYPLADVWPTAVRFMRIDRGATLREKDADSGYLLFDLPEGQKSYKGSLELVRATDSEERESTRIVVTIADLPRHVELTLLEKLAFKGREEYGSPAAPPPRKPPASEPGKRPAPDAGLKIQDLPRIPQGELPRPEKK